VSGQIITIPNSAAFFLYSPFSITFKCEQVRPDKYHNTGGFLVLGGIKTEKIISQLFTVDL
jgi:hypothetical protein